MVMTYRGGFNTRRMEVFGTFWLCKSTRYQIHMIHLYLNCYMVVIWTVTAVKKIFLFQAYSNLIKHLQLEKCEMEEVASSKERKKIKHTQIALLLLH